MSLGKKQVFLLFNLWQPVLWLDRWEKRKARSKFLDYPTYDGRCSGLMAEAGAQHEASFATTQPMAAGTLASVARVGKLQGSALT